ncbi:MAG: DUF2520 domain-containing protein [Bifidobacteriaceae bacterium]|jgi:predicted short-subunit dehydrogenase-like oxidoreductase (DUF2520 family)|nr:DUF2520 domain-containing protein [Bifidobacteriaceae bacterium]
MVGGKLPAGIIGFGRVGGAFAGALAQAGHPVVAVAARSEANRERADLILPGVQIGSPRDVAQNADLVFLTVGDDGIGHLVAELLPYWRPGQLVVHASGAFGVDVLAPAAEAGAIALAVHPVMTFTGTSLDVARMRGAPFAVDAAPGMAPLAEALAIELGGAPFPLPGAARPAYHAALSHAANHLVTLVAQAADLLRASGVADPARVLGPLTRAALEEALSRGAAALTGPASRGDVGTLAAHVAALGRYAAARGALAEGEVAVDADAAVALDAIASYVVLARATARAALAAGLLTPERAAAAEQALREAGR